MNKIIVAICGKSGSGKDTIAKHLTKMNPTWHNIVSCTTRPIRDNEIDGVDYHFLTNEEFAEKVLNGDMLEATFFNNWHYGTLQSDLYNGINIGVFDPAGFSALTENPPPDVVVIGFYIICPDKIRLMRSLMREDNPDVDEIVRRYTTDKEDFIDFEANHNIKAGNILSNVNRNELAQNLVYITNNVNDIWADIDKLPH